MRYEVNAYTTKYEGKLINEDSILVNDCVLSDGFFQKKCDLDEFLYTVCDGVSGSDKGYYASSYVNQALINLEFKDCVDFKHALYDINHGLVDAGVKIGAPDLSTTFAGIYFKDQMNILAVGDSRVYKVKDGEVNQITSDDTVANQLFLDGVLNYEESLNHPQKNVLVNYFGNNDNEFRIQSYEDNDFNRATYFIMSDGISDFIPQERLFEIMKSPIDGFDKLRLMVGEALVNNSNDDLSLIILEVE